MPPILIHEDPEFFRAVTFTAATTGFQARLIEKDYFCSMLLQYLAEANGSLIFKGGTCLAKVLVDFTDLAKIWISSSLRPLTPLAAREGAKQHH